eukprot:COSAG06_NODE_1519_length_9208_cov_3.443957_5_plen_53_part_00
MAKQQCPVRKSDILEHSVECLGSGLVVLSLLWTALLFAFFVVGDFRGRTIGR